MHTPPKDTEARPLRWRIVMGLLKLAAFILLLDLVLFLLFDVLPDPAAIQLGIFSADPALLEAARERMGLSGPWYERLLTHWRKLLQGDLGQTLVGGHAIGPLFASRLSQSLPLWGGSLLLLAALPLPLAMAFASRRIGRIRYFALQISRLSTAPQFLAATVFYAGFVGFSPVMPGPAAHAVRWMLAMFSCVLLPAGMLLVASANTFQTAACQPYCDTYAALGMSRWRIRRRLVRNVLLAVRPLVARLTIGLFTGTIFAELLFGIEGFGHLFVEAIRTSDLNVMRLWVLLTGIVVTAIMQIERTVL